MPSPASVVTTVLPDSVQSPTNCRELNVAPTQGSFSDTGAEVVAEVAADVTGGLGATVVDAGEEIAWGVPELVESHPTRATAATVSRPAIAAWPDVPDLIGRAPGAPGRNSRS
ncbi:hypothetical protein GCM10023114_32120 [Mycolicibacterium sediminis]|uniref:Uncharacterized protein n=1 Tax=Mycolicibacterium sediminis TaxID=1286180 RepID=A0A7I7QKF5_9MYCO|nr:hypothetical protein MSEDJ_08410 [Mycolicibacterium sediminis]